ncbi:MAG: AAA family ATPase, partial [Candidatus Gracilibacteria bacterium]|nr:AAA family ATPase [Candidatus Gracilibacteria bacterium]
MKITESKFYKHDAVFATRRGNRGELLLVDANNTNTSSTPFENLLDSQFARMYLEDSSLIITAEKLKQFEKCDDYVSMQYSKKYNRFYEDELCYFHHDLELFILLSKNLVDKPDEQDFEDGIFRVKYVYYDNSNLKSRENLNFLLERLLEKYISKESKISILLRNNHGIELKTHTIHSHRIDFTTMYNDDFASVHHRIKDEITTENKGIVLLHGVPGSGKTNYIKWLTSQIPSKKFIFVPTTMISSLTDPGFLSILIENKNSVLVLEDCENYIAERTELDRNTDVVSSILNLADGILSDVMECQFICTFNSDISKIDTALLRKGRLIAEYKFRELSIEKSNQYLQSIGKKLCVDRPHTLAELTHIDTEEIREHEKS